MQFKINIMKKSKLLIIPLLLLPIFLFGQKEIMVMPMGDGIYQVSVSGQGNGRFKSLAHLKGIAFEKASDYALNKEAEIEVVSVNETPMSFGVFNQVDLKFRLVSKSEKLADPNQNSIKQSNTYDANGRIIDSEVTVKSKELEKEDDDKFIKLKQIGELYEKGYLTKEEFETEKAKILSK